MTENDDSTELSENWLVVTGAQVAPEVVTAVLNEALAAAPREVLASEEALVPRSRRTGRCRICGKAEQLSREHIPPRSAGNDSTAEVQYIEDWLRRDDPEHVPNGGESESGGIWGRVLCEPCNNYTGRYATEYRDWARRGAGVLNQIAEKEGVADLASPSALLEASPNPSRGRRAVCGCAARQVHAPGAEHLCLAERALGSRRSSPRPPTVPSVRCSL